MINVVLNYAFFHLNLVKEYIFLCIGECPSISPFLEDNGPRPIVFKGQRKVTTSNFIG